MRIHRDIYLKYDHFSVADQKKNPNAVVTALKYYAASLKEQENAKFMTPNSIYNQSDEVRFSFVFILIFTRI